MPKINLSTKDREGNIKSSGYIEIKNQTEENAELYFYGDIVSDSWSSTGQMKINVHKILVIF